MKITKSHLRKIIQEELRELKNISDPVRAVGGTERPRLEEWAFKLMNELTPEIPALQELPERKFDGAVKRIADGMWEGLMSAIELAPEPRLEEALYSQGSPMGDMMQEVVQNIETQMKGLLENFKYGEVLVLYDDLNAAKKTAQSYIKAEEKT